MRCEFKKIPYKTLTCYNIYPIPIGQYAQLNFKNSGSEVTSWK